MNEIGITKKIAEQEQCGACFMCENNLFVTFISQKSTHLRFFLVKIIQIESK